ncbi:MAG: hypothetical protein VB086_07240 [Clostridiaceae bacterium]|nr:hypothetical protein [Clostridiaceae bacterium]
MLVTHAPADEYDSESKTIYDKLRVFPIACVDDLAEVISDVFTKSFGHDAFHPGINECKQIASKISAEDPAMPQKKEETTND